MENIANSQRQVYKVATDMIHNDKVNKNYVQQFNIANIDSEHLKTSYPAYCYTT